MAEELEKQKEAPKAQDIIDFLALNANEIKQLTDCYKSIDTDASGLVSYFILLLD